MKKRDRIPTWLPALGHKVLLAVVALGLPSSLGATSAGDVRDRIERIRVELGAPVGPTDHTPVESAGWPNWANWANWSNWGNWGNWPNVG